MWTTAIKSSLSETNRLRAKIGVFVDHGNVTLRASSVRYSWPFLIFFLASCGGGGGGGDGAGPAPAPLPPATFYPNGAPIPVSGPDVPGVAPFDQGITEFMRKWNVPGAAIAVAKDGKLLLARGYGYADFESRQAAQPDSMFRIGSASKVLTALAILRLRDQGQLDLDQPFLSILTDYQLGPNADTRLQSVTLRDLLRHSGGWDREIIGDFLFSLNEISSVLGVPKPVSTADVIRYSLTRPLQFAPGTRFAYSNVGYIILGRVIERVSGQSYESYVREQVLAPLDVHAPSIAASHLAQRGPFEVKYYAYYASPEGQSEFPGEGRVPQPYQFDMQRLDAAGGWVVSPVDLTRIIAALDSQLEPGFLSADSLTQLFAPPPYSAGTAVGLSYPASTWYGFAMSIGPTNRTYGHGGALPGTAASVFHDASGYSMAVLMNTQGGPEPLYFDVVSVMTQALGTALQGSASDLYAQYPSPSLPGSKP
jgi:N-acyl-D-amino-acid deacylase